VISAQSFFHLFSIPATWNIDRVEIDAQYRKLQQEFHPDKYATKSDVERKMAVQASSLVNEAYHTLTCPLRRAQYLLRLQGIDSGQGNHTTDDREFLTQQILLREELAELEVEKNAHEAITDFEARLQEQYESLQTKFEDCYKAANYEAASGTVVKMQFFVKLLRQVEELDNQL